MNSNGPGRLFYREFNAPDTNNGIAAHTDDDKNYQFFTRLALHDFTFTGSYVSREKGIPTASFGTVFNDPHNRTTDEHGFLDLKYTHSFEDQTEVTARTYFDRFYYRGDYLYDRANQGDPPLTVLDKDLARSYRWGGELQATKTLFGRHKVTSGIEFRDNIRQDQSNYDENPYVRYLDDRRRSSNWALFLQDEIRLLDSLIFTAGVRYDHYDTVGGTTNPRLALIYKPLEGTVFKLLYGEAFRAPGPFEFYYDDGQTVKSNPQLKPEKIRTYELVYEQYFLEHFRSSLSGFYYRINDLISQQQISPDLFQFNNIDMVDARGVELELEGRYDNGLKGRFSYTYQDTRNLNTGSTLTNSPRHLAKLNLILPLFRDKVFSGIEEQYTGSRMTIAGRQAASFCVTNLTLFSQSLLPGLDFSASIYNLFDKHYDDPGAAEHRQDVIEQDGRTFRVKLTYLF
jgi:iron complex outermembrane receptor protein